MKPDPEIEEKVEKAIVGLYNNTFPSVAAAARAVGLNKSTLHYRVHGQTHSIHEAHLPLRLLSFEQEQVLVEWCKYSAMLALPLRRSTLYKKVFALTGRVPGKHWYERFIKRHPELTLRKPSALDPKRASGFNFEAVTDYFAQLGAVLREYNIPPENTYNEDEKGIQLGGGRKGSGMKYLFDAGEEIHYKLKSDSLELVTVIECVSADGAKGPGPSFVVSQAKDPGEWYEIDGVSGCATSPSGWIDDYLFHQWFIQVFIPHATARNTSQTPILLILNNHHSHISFELINTAYENGIFLFCFPSKTTHKLQPLDIAVFSPLQRAWAQRSEEAVAMNNTITTRTVIPEYMKL